MPRFLGMTLVTGLICALPVAALYAQEPPRSAPASQPAAKAATKSAATSTDPIERIKEEGLKRSQVMATLSYLTDVIGPRLTGSPNMKRANEWTRDKLAAWGLANSHLEAWGPFGRGWTLKRFSAQIIEPQCIPLIGFPKAWSPGTDGTLVARVVYFDAKTEGDFASYKGKLKSAVVLTSPTREVAARWTPLANRKTDSELLKLADAGEQSRRGRFNSPERRARMERQRRKGSSSWPRKGPLSSSIPAHRAIAPTSTTAATAEPCLSNRLRCQALPCPYQVKLAVESTHTTRMRQKTFPRSFWPRSTTTGSCECANKGKSSRWSSTSRFSFTTMT